MVCNKEIIIPNVKPKYEVGQTVFRILYDQLIQKNTIRKVDYMNRGEGVRVVYYFYRERTPFNEDIIFATEEEARLALMKIDMRKFQNRFLSEMKRLKSLGMTEQEIAARLNCKEIKLLSV